MRGNITSLSYQTWRVRKRGRMSRRRRPQWEVWGARSLSESRGGALFGGFLCRSSWYNEVLFHCHSAGRQRALSLPISDKNICDTCTISVVFHAYEARRKRYFSLQREKNKLSFSVLHTRGAKVYGCSWVSMGIYGCLWVSGCLWVFMDIMGVCRCYMGF